LLPSRLNDKYKYILLNKFLYSKIYAST